MTAQQTLREHIEEVADWRKAGITKKEIAQRLHIAVNTMYRVAKTDTEIANALFGEEYAVKTEKRKPEENEMKLHANALESEKEMIPENKTESTSCVCQGLRKRCTGYQAVVTKHYKVKRPFLDQNGMPVLDGAKRQVMTEELEKVEEVQDIPPDLDAIKFFLMNQDKETWKIDPERIRQEGKKAETHGKSFEEWLQEIDEMEEMEHEE